MKITSYALIGSLLVFSHSVSASCLDEASNFAERICGEISNRGSSKLVAVNGSLNAEAKGVLARILGTAQGDAKVDYVVTEYDNVIREQLSAEHANARDCKREMVKVAERRVCIEYKTCRLPEFGQVGWQREEVLNGTSGWRGGGYNQGAYCSDYIASIVNSHGLGGQQYKADIINSSEEGRWTGFRHREYNYHCSVRLSWSPIYNEKTDPRCGALN